MTETRKVTTVEEADALREVIEGHAADLWDVDEATGKVDWDDWCRRFEDTHDVELPDQYDDPAMRRVQSIARAAIREARS